jgi:hypothetical protein
MDKTSPPDVLSAFDILLKEIEAEIKLINDSGAEAFLANDHCKAGEFVDRARNVKAFEEEVKKFRDKWIYMQSSVASLVSKKSRAKRRDLGRLPCGERTTESEYYIPILQVLDRMGGKGEVKDVLEEVKKIMEPKLKPADYEPLNSNSNELRWRRSAQWARFDMVKQGLLRADSPRGVWEMTEEGRIYLRRAIARGDRS